MTTAGRICSSPDSTKVCISATLDWPECGEKTDDLVSRTCALPHCEGVLSNPWEDHSPDCPAGRQGHSCRDCDAAVDEFAIRRP